MREEAVGLLEHLLGHDLPHEPVRRGRIEGDGGAAAGLERDQLPDLGVAREEEYAHRGSDGYARYVGADHHGPTGNRSPTTPPNASIDTCASVHAAKLSPTAVAPPPLSRIANATAIGARYVPTYEIARAANR